MVGRSPDASWRLDDPYLSRHQFRVDLSPLGCRLTHLSRTNATLVNGSRVSEVELKDGDRIDCGPTVFVVAMLSPAASS